MREQFTFSQVPTADIPRSVFNRSHGHKTTFNSGLLIPIYVDEALPGDTFNVNMSAFARLATPIVPIMDNMRINVFFFAVPNRLLWVNWQRFMGEQDNPGDSIDFLVPQTYPPTGGWPVHSLADYFGIPLYNDAPNSLVNALPFRAYALIYNEWFRDENLIGKNTVRCDTGDGPDDGAAYPLRRRGKRHDYFTSALPWPQKGPGVELPIGASAPIVGTGAPIFNDGRPTHQWEGANLQLSAGTTGTQPADIGNVVGSPTAGEALFWQNPALVADLSQATSATINKLREAFQLQKLLERDARGGTRYTEILRSHFGVTSPDARLQRPEYLGGGIIPVNINPVTQTSGTPPTDAQNPYISTPQGNLAAYGVAGGTGVGFTKSFVEHSTILGLVEVSADLSYSQGIARPFLRRTRYDYYWPALSHLGEQAVLNKEIYFQGVPGTSPGQDEAAFGYQERWAEYRYFPSKITGLFRHAPAGNQFQSLDYWHLAQKFTSLPTLSQTFIEDNPPIQRVVAVQAPEPEFMFDSQINIHCARPMPTYSVPGYIDHF